MNNQSSPNSMSNSNHKFKPIPRVLPVKLNQLIELDFIQTFTAKQRLQLASGYNLDIKLRIACQHHPGQIGVVSEFKTTKELPPKGTT